MDFVEFRRRREALARLKRLSQFDDDPCFLVEVDGAVPLRERIQAPSRVVLEHAIWREGLDNVKVRVSRSTEAHERRASSASA